MSGFFGFDTNVPSLGAGKFDDLDAALPDDDEIDIVNDETFGAGAVFDGDWEEAHEKLAEQLETFKYEGHGHHRTSSFGNGQNHRYEDEAQLGALREDDFHQSDTFTSQEDDLEKSLSQLVVDDDEIDDPAIMNLSKNRPIPQAKNNNLDNLFGPSSPPAFLNTEHLVSPGKTNIWGSPATRDSYLDPTPPMDDGGIKNLLNMLKGKTPSQPAPFQDPSIVMAGKPTPMSNVRSLDELEQELINGKSPSGGSGMGSGMPIPKNNNRPMTVEDLEREMRGQPIPTPPGGRPHHGQAPIGTPPQGGHMQHHSQRMSGNNKPNMAHSTSPGQHFSSSPHAPGYSHSTAPITIAKRGTPPSTGFQGSPADRHGPKNIPPFLSNQPVQQRMPFPGGFNDNNRGGFNENNRGRGPHHHQGPPPPRGHPMFNQNQPGFDPRYPNDRPPGDRFQNGRHPSGDRFPPGDRYPPGPMDDRYGPGPGDRGFPNGDFHGRHPGDHHMDRGRGFNPMDRGGRGGFNGRGRGGFDGPMDHPGRGGFDMRMRGGPPDMRGGRGGFDMRGRGRGGFHHQRWRSNSEADEEDYEMGGGGDRDVFANLMTQKEKDWIIKIQLMQIHTADPYLDDYYYTKWQMEKLIRERAAKAGSKGEPKLVLPQLAKADGRLYKPVQFEGSLGRLTASSVHNPRQIIDVRVKTNTGDEDGRHKEIRRFKQLLIHIEKSYDLLLEIDDVEKRAMALPEGSRPPLYRERAVRIHELYELLHLEPQDDISFVQLLTVRKGTKLVARTIPFLAKEHALPVVAAILQSILSVIKRDLQDEVMAQLFEPMARVVAELELAELVLLTNLLIAPVAELGAPLLSFMLQSKFGASLVWSIVSRGEVIFRTVSPVDLDVANQNDWTAFLHNLGEAAAQTPELAQPFYVFPTVPAYLQQQLGMTTYSTLEERLASTLVPTTHDMGASTPPIVQVAC